MVPPAVRAWNPEAIPRASASVTAGVGSQPELDRADRPGRDPRLSTVWSASRVSSSLPFTARVLAAALTESVQAARAGDAAAFDEASTRLGTLDAEQVRLVLGSVVRSLLEQQHPDGLDGCDLEAVIERCSRGCAGWFPVDPGVLVVVLVSALGAADPEALEHPPLPADVLRHAVVVTADLLSTTGRPLAPTLTAAFAELRRAETLEHP